MIEIKHIWHRVIIVKYDGSIYTYYRLILTSISAGQIMVFVNKNAYIRCKKNVITEPMMGGIYMATAIIYFSKHHGNTKKIVDAISAEHTDVELVDVTVKNQFDLSSYDKIGFASGIYYGKLADQILNFAKENLPSGKDVFLIATAGNPVESNFNAITKIIKNMNCRDIGHFICRGFDTFGPLKLIGGIQKGHPTEEEIQAAVDFYNSIV